MKELILSIDQGTTGTTVLIINKTLKILAKKNNEFKQYYPKPGWVEHDPEEIWKLTVKTIKQALKKAKVKGEKIACIGITNQRETTLIWNRNTHRPIHRAIVWQDRRTADTCAALTKAGQGNLVRNKTGLVLDPYFSGTKIKWLLEHVTGARQAAQNGKLAFGTIDSFLVWQLTAGKSHVTDVSNASRTLLMSLHERKWDDELLELFQVPPSLLPKLVSNAEVYGTTKDVPGLPDGIPISGMAGDQQAALFGQACFNIGDAKCTYGTGSFMLMNIGAQPLLSEKGLLTSVAWQLGNRVIYALEGSSFIAGAAVQWLRDELKIIKESKDIEKLAASVPDSGGVIMVPAFAGLGAPHWNPHARGLICGLTRGSSRAHIARATLEGIAFQQMEIVEAMEAESGKKCPELRVDGGAAANNLLMQFQADILGTQIVRPRIIETTAFGAAFLAGLGIGLWKSESEILKAWRKDRVFKPQFDQQQRAELKKRWTEAVHRAGLCR